MTVDVSPLPSLAAAPGGLAAENRLRTARRSATAALAKAEAAEEEARKLRRTAKAAIRRYEKLVAEYNGQLRLPGT